MQKIKILIVYLVILSCMLSVYGSAFASIDVAAGSAILIEASTGQVLYDKNSDVALPPASITKLMTLVLAFEALETGKVKWEDEVTVSEAAWRMGGSKMYIEVGKRVKYGELITGISVVSGNDACIAVAEHLYGSENVFVKNMNAMAKKLGLTKSNFLNSTGMPAEGHKMSARDIANLAKYLIETYPRILEIESMREYTFNGIRQDNRNPLLGSFPGADGLKTGWTTEAGYCLVGTASQGGMRLISVVLNTENENQRKVVSQELLNYGFRNYEIVNAISENETIALVPVKNGKKFNVAVKSLVQIPVVVTAGQKDNIKLVVKDMGKLNAPVTAGTVVGSVEVQLDGKVYGSTELVTVEDVPKINFIRRFFRWIKNLIAPSED